MPGIAASPSIASDDLLDRRERDPGDFGNSSVGHAGPVCGEDGGTPTRTRLLKLRLDAPDCAARRAKLADQAPGQSSCSAMRKGDYTPTAGGRFPERQATRADRPNASARLAARAPAGRCESRRGQQARRGARSDRHSRPNASAASSRVYASRSTGGATASRSATSAASASSVPAAEAVTAGPTPLRRRPDQSVLAGPARTEERGPPVPPLGLRVRPEERGARTRPRRARADTTQR